MSKIFKIALPVALWVTLTAAFVSADRSAEPDNAPPASEIKASLDKVPKAVFPEAKYNFASVYEGVDVKHDFIVENQGEAALLIRRVRPDCGCSVASNPGRIPAGGKGVISVTVRTGNRGGGTLHKGFSVFTNDPFNERVRLEVAGQVMAYLSVSPPTVRLVGLVGRDLKQTVRITASPGHPFKVEGITTQHGENLRYELKPLAQRSGSAGYELLVENTLPKPGNYRDLIIVRTDCREKPSISIPVYGRILSTPD